MTDSTYERRRMAQKGAANADQVELDAIRLGSTNTDQGVFDERVAGALDDYIHGGDEAVALEWHDQDLALDDAVGAVQSDIERRAEILGQAYPFQLRHNKIEYRESASLVYEFCLAASLAPDLRPMPYANIPRVFERLSSVVAKKFLGPTSASLHVGEPRDADATFREAMKALSAETGEWSWDPEAGHPTEGPSQGDESLDYVAWKRIDERVGSLFLVGQCACGREGWDKKLAELDLRRLAKWFRPMTFVEPVRSFAAPLVLSDGNLVEASRRGGLVFDRLRMTKLAATSEDEEILEMREQFRALVDLVLAA